VVIIYSLKGELLPRIGPLSGDDALQDRRKGQLGWQHRSLSFECKSTRVEELADIRQASVYL